MCPGLPSLCGVPGCARERNSDKKKGVSVLALAVAIIYFVIIIVLSIWYSRKNVKSAEDFTKAGQGMGWLMVTFSFVLVPLGSGHTLSLWQQAAAGINGGIGASAVWWAVGAGCIFLPIMMLWLGPWVRESRLGTMPEIIEKMFGRSLGSVHAAFQTMTWTGIGISEVIATGTAIYGLTGGAIPLRPTCVIIALVLMLCYVLFGGVLQMAWLNIINSVVLIGGSYLALGMIGVWLAANMGGWDGIKEIYTAAGMGNKLMNFELNNPDVWFNVIIPVVVLHTCAGAVSQCMNTTFFAAKDNRACRKGVFLGAGINVMSCVPWVIIALVGMVVPALLANPALDVSTVVPLLAIEALPAPIVGVLMVSLLAACLSTGGSVLMGNGMVIASDVIKRPWKPNMDDKTFMKLLRVCIVVQAIILVIGALSFDVVFPIFIWCFSFGIPVFVVYLCGQVWKVSRPAAWITIVVTYIVNIYWTFWTPAFSLGTPLELNMYPVTICSVVLGVILTAVLPGTPGLRTKKYAALHPGEAIVRS